MSLLRMLHQRPSRLNRSEVHHVSYYLDIARRSRNQRVRRFCLRRMWFVEGPLSKKGQKRRAAVYREASRRDCWDTVWVRPAGLAWHAALDRVRGGDAPVPVE